MTRLQRAWRVRQGLFTLGLAVACGRRELPHGEARRDSTAPSTQGSGRHAAPIAVSSPAAGEVWVEGETYTIRWRANGFDQVNIGVAMGGKDKGHIALGTAAAADSLRWRVPPGFVSGFGLSRSDAVRVRLEDARDPTRFVESAPFTVVAPGGGS